MDAIVIGCIWLILGIFIGIMASSDMDNWMPLGGIILTGLGVFCVTKGLNNYNNNDSECPTAMEVYQGKTALKIIYEDGVAVDSAVVFKTIKNKSQ